MFISAALVSLAISSAAPSADTDAQGAALLAEEDTRDAFTQARDEKLKDYEATEGGNGLFTAGRIRQIAATKRDLVAAEATAKQVSPRVRPVEEVAEEPGWFGEHYAFGLDETLDPEIDKNIAVLWILSIVLGGYAGPLWIPKIIVGEDPGPEYGSVALWYWVWEIGIEIINIIPFIYPIGIFCPPVGAVSTAHLLARAFWFGPVGTINLYNRHVLKTKAGGGGGGDKMKKKKMLKKKVKEAGIGADHVAALPGVPRFAGLSQAGLAF